MDTGARGLHYVAIQDCPNVITGMSKRIVPNGTARSVWLISFGIRHSQCSPSSYREGIRSIILFALSSRNIFTMSKRHGSAEKPKYSLSLHAGIIRSAAEQNIASPPPVRHGKENMYYENNHPQPDSNQSIDDLTNIIP